uniref:Uncharacterized protein n=1 Tax=Chromera velia CCMP2878 TaxID=1169474 RepID=A0A0G4HXY8_9ALVE|eukprot:Cvel_9385.t1-p1 / transcript=Cvel_9385.t1 / gene=Cvel_9385 / organism=Chromera_velia_CCMP2878 / gene_product=hypothetical protein / transcript_product=hypothetical protein / location=Cvel_scaffold539:30124-31398(+) / protein_length=318 / sequence_SO=supercontig / SO=protein_coding / is_pseudo=false
MGAPLEKCLSGSFVPYCLYYPAAVTTDSPEGRLLHSMCTDVLAPYFPEARAKDPSSDKKDICDGLSIKYRKLLAEKTLAMQTKAISSMEEVVDLQKKANLAVTIPAEAEKMDFLEDRIKTESKSLFSYLKDLARRAFPVAENIRRGVDGIAESVTSLKGVTVSLKSSRPKMNLKTPDGLVLAEEMLMAAVDSEVLIDQNITSVTSMLNQQGAIGPKLKRGQTAPFGFVKIPSKDVDELEKKLSFALDDWKGFRGEASSRAKKLDVSKHYDDEKIVKTAEQYQEIEQLHIAQQQTLVKYVLYPGGQATSGAQAVAATAG